MNEKETEQLHAALQAMGFNPGHVENFAETGPPPVRLRSLAICGPIVEETSVAVIRALLQLEAEEPDSPIVMFINTPGGMVYDGFAIYDAMKATSCPIITVGFGKIMSAGILLISAGDKGNRFALPNTCFMTHDLQCVSAGSFLDTEAQHKHTLELRNRYIKLVAANCKLTEKQLRDSLAQEKYFWAADAQKLGLIDEVSMKKPKAYFTSMG